MFFILSKTIYHLILPLPVTVMLLLVSIYLKNKIIAKKLRYIAIMALVFFSNPFIANQAMKWWEGVPTPLTTLKNHDIAIVLTGVTNRYKSPKDRVYFAHGADRVLHTIQLYKMGKISRIIISGGSGKLIKNLADLKEADELALVFKMNGVPDSDITIENSSRNTYESASNISHLESTLSRTKVLLITSGFHMRRAQACFTKQNIPTTAFRTDFYSQDNKYTLDSIIIPKPEAINQWNIIIHEILGLIMYKTMGYC